MKLTFENSFIESVCVPIDCVPQTVILKGIKVINMFQVTLLVLDKELTYPLLLSVNLLFSTAIVSSQDSGSTSDLPSSSPPSQNANEEV
jgi:hypothetical protein